ncbi:MAG: YceI family protein [Propionibacteriales bacterium]|nr:YceI family protein [Propionibacteriales bacterium]
MNGTVATATTRSVLPGLAVGTWTIDPAHTAVGFSVRHVMSRVRGTFREVSGHLTITDDPTQSTATATIDLASVDTGDELRDSHLRSGDFFDVEQTPTMTFVGAGLFPRDGGWVLSGYLTVRDITRPVDLDVELLGVDPTGIQGETRIGFEARATIRRQDFGITFDLAVPGNKVVIGDKVEISLDVEAVLDADNGAGRTDTDDGWAGWPALNGEVA